MQKAALAWGGFLHVAERKIQRIAGEVTVENV